MNLPLVIDLAIGLVFIYLILSLLTSEIQELIATLLQWRAEHLKKSIETLITGETFEDPFYQKFVDDFYNSPLIRSLNQEAKGLLASFFRRIVHTLSAAYHTLTRTRNVFGQHHSAPSYIPPETFSVALLEKINIVALSRKISELTARKFKDENLEALREILEDLRVSLGDDPFLVGNGSLVDKEFGRLEQNLEHSIMDFVSGRTTLSDSIDQIAEQLCSFIGNTDALLSNQHHCKEVIRQRLSYLRQAIARKRLEPTVTEVLRLIFTDADDSSITLSSSLADVMARLHSDSPELVQGVVTLPQHLKRNLITLAGQARLKAKSLEEEVRQLEKEVANWFENSMQRASGVYRRNAKGISILIGFLVAILINADTFHMVDRLSRDTLLRSAIMQTVDQVTVGNPAPDVPSPSPPELPPATAVSPAVPPDSSTIQQDLEEVREAVDVMLDETTLPIGWNPTNVEQQQQNSQGWAVPILKPLLGWLITGIALSMGATFWFDLLNRVVRVRGTGEKPEEKD